MAAVEGSEVFLIENFSVGYYLFDAGFEARVRNVDILKIGFGFGNCCIIQCNPISVTAGGSQDEYAGKGK